MSHALIWTEIDPQNQDTELVKELPFAGFGTITSGSWNKKIFKLKWINSSVDEVKLWLENPYGDVYFSTEFPKYKSTDSLDIIEDLRFDFRITALNTYNLEYLKSANVATNLNLTSSSLGATSYLLAPLYIDGTKINIDSTILLKSQTDKKENGLYQIVAQTSGGVGFSNLSFYNGIDTLTAGKIVSIGGSSWYSYLEGYTPFQFASIGTTDVIWVDRTSTYRLKNVDTATTSNLNISGSGLSNNSLLIDNYTLSLNDRVLVKNQTDKKQNGIYYVSSLYDSNKNTIVNPNTSTSTSDNYWKIALNNLRNGNPVTVQVLEGSTYGGKTFRLYQSTDSEVIAYGALDDGVVLPDDLAGYGSTTQLSWSDVTHFYNSFTADWYYEIGVGSSIGFSFDTTGNSGTFTSAPNYITNYNDVSTLTVANQTVLVKHYNPKYSGVYTIQSVGSGNTSVWVRNINFDSATEIIHTVVKTTNNKSNLESQFFYLSKNKPYDSNFLINQSDVAIGERYLPYEYEPVKNLVTSEITNFDNVVETKFYNSGIAISQRVLVSGQATTESQNGIYVVNNASTANTVGLTFYNTYSIVNGSIANSSGTGSTFFLYSDLDYVSAGTTSVSWVDITTAPTQNVDLVSVVDKFEAGYIYPDNFVGSIGSTGTVLVNTSNTSVNGLYDVSLGSAQKASFKYPDNLKLWAADIYRNITGTNTDTYTVTPNFRNEIEGIYIARNIGGFGDSTYADRKYGNVYVPEIKFPNTENPLSYFTDEGKGSAFLQEIDFEWHTQDYQNYVVKAVYNKANELNLPLSAGTAISRKISNNTLISNDEDVLFYIGTGASTGSTYNGIYRAVVSSVGASVYFTRHEDFHVSTSYDSNSNIKTIGSPYERPTKVIVQNGYFVQGAAFGYTSIYMIGEIGYKVNNSAFGSSTVDSYDMNQYNIGQETFIKNSEIKLSRDYENLFDFAKIAPIQHVLIGDLANQDQVNGDMLIISRGYRLYSTLTSSAIKYYYEEGDRIIYQDSNEDLFTSLQTNNVNGIYVITHINSNTWTYYLRKVKQNASIGHIDYPRRLDIHPDFNITDGSFPLVKYGGTGITYTWAETNYYKYDVFVVDQNGNKTSLEHMVDYDMFPDIGQIASYTSFGSTSDTLYVYILANNDVPKLSEYPKPLYNRYHYVPQVLTQKFQAQSSTAKTSGSYSADNYYFQITNKVGSATTLDYRNNTDRNLWYKTFSNSNNYYNDIKHVVSIGDTNDYFYTKRLSTDGYFYKAGTAQTALYYDSNIFEPGTGKSTGIFYGKLYLDKVSVSGTGFSLVDWFNSLSLSNGDNVLILNNNTSSIASTLQSNYYNDNNILTTHNVAGKRDQKVYEFSELTYKAATLTEHALFTNPISPVRVNDGASIYFLHYNPSITSRSATPKKWFNLGAVNIYDCDIATNSNISDFDNLGGVINSYNVVSGDLVLVKNQTDAKKNGIYSAKTNKNFRLDRSDDMNQSSELRNLGRVSFNNRIYELILPSTTPYTIGNTAGNTPIAWKLVGTGYSIDARVATTSNYSGTALTTAFPDSIDGVTLTADDKVLLYSQSDETTRYVGRFTQNAAPILLRVTEGGSGDTSHFSITNCYVFDENRSKYYELYFNPNNTGLGVSQISWFERNFINDYENADLKTTTNVTISGIPSITDQFAGALVLVKDQTTKSQNGLYYIDNNASFYLTRHENLDNDSELASNKKVYVSSGIANSGYYALYLNESGTPSLGSSNIYFVNVNESYQLDDCVVASTTALNLASLPSSVDDVILKYNDRILVKDQADKTENGIYVVSDVKNKTWVRANDLNIDAKLLPQLTVKITNGTTYSDSVWRIKLPIPREITNSQSTAYILDTDNIEWIEINQAGLYSSDPSTWQKFPSSIDNAFYLGKAKINENSVSSSSKFAIAIKAPNSNTLAAVGITESGRIRNIKLKVEYKTIED